MFVTKEIKENLFVENLVKSFKRSVHQINKLQESDAELLELPNCKTILALTTDGICEEIEQKIYDDPYMIGWMTVTANLSDLAAVGASPLGILLNQTFTHELSADYISKLQKGIADATDVYGTFIFGGDTNYSSVMQMSGTALGVIENGKPMMRIGCNIGDIVYTSGKLGNGNTFAFSKLAGTNHSVDFKPNARLLEGKLLSKYASSCMDTSDGFFATLDQLIRINNLGFRISNTIHEYINAETINLCDSQKIPYWFMLAGIHGEFELVFTISPKKEKEFISEAEVINWHPIKLGKIITEPKVECLLNNKFQDIDTGGIRNLLNETDKNIQYLLAELMRIEKQFL